MSAEWLDQFHADASPLEAAMVASAREDAKEAATAEREKAERASAAEQRLEALTTAERLAGNPLASMSAARSAFAEADDEVRELQTRLEKAQARRSRAEDNLKFFAERADLAAGMAQRSAPTVTGGRDLLEPARRAAAEAIRSQDVLRRARRSQERRRPRLSMRSVTPNGDGPPKDQCGCGVPGCTAYPPDSGTERSAAGYGREITRVVSADGMGQFGTLGGVRIR
jgi:hypothetical protein